MSEEKFPLYLSLLWCCRTNFLLRLSSAFGWREHAFVSTVRTVTYCLMASKLWNSATTFWIFGIHAFCVPLIYFRVYQILHILGLALIGSIFCTSNQITQKKIIMGHAILLLYCMQRADGLIMCATTISAYIAAVLIMFNRIQFGGWTHLTTDIIYLVMIAYL